MMVVRRFCIRLFADHRERDDSEELDADLPA
jgi:hypothetical protein